MSAGQIVGTVLILVYVAFVGSICIKAHYRHRFLFKVLRWADTEGDLLAAIDDIEAEFPNSWPAIEAALTDSQRALLEAGIPHLVPTCTLGGQTTIQTAGPLVEPTDLPT